jgi:glycosyltransferase involved in cell wall biosynthesis
MMDHRPGSYNMNATSKLMTLGTMFFDTILQKTFPSMEVSLPKNTDIQPKISKPDVAVSIITQYYPPDFAATGQLIEELSNHLGEQGVEVEVFTSQPGYAFNVTDAPKTEQIGRVHIQRSQTAQLWPRRVRGKAVNGVLYTLRAALHLIRHAHEKKVVLLTTAPPFLPILGYLFNAIWKTPYVCLIYDLYPDIAVQLHVLPAQHWIAKLWRKINKLVWRNAQEIIVLSPAMKQRILDQCPEVADKVEIIHSWANPEWIVPMPKHENWFSVRYGLVKPFTVLYSGNMGRCHDMTTIFDAALRLQNENIRFVFIGSGAQSNTLMDEAKRLGLTNIVFLPYQDREILPYSLTSCDMSLVSILPEMEGLVAPSKLYSALAAGRPTAVICPSYSYLNQLVQDAGCGATFNNGDSQGLASFILKLSCDRQHAEQMGEAGRQYLKENFTPKMIASQYLWVLSMAARRNQKTSSFKSH